MFPSMSSPKSRLMSRSLGIIGTLNQCIKHALDAAYLFVVLISVGCFSISVQAEKQVELYHISQLVLDQSVSLRQQATTAGLATVIVRVSGDPQALNAPLVKEALSKSTNYLTQYSYNSTDEKITIAGESRPARRLLLHYSAPAIQRLLQTAQLAIWPDNRPEVLLWLVSDQQGSRALQEAQSVSVLAFKEAADNRGLPIANPLLDLVDRQKLSSARLWAMDEIAIRSASARYETEGILAGRLTVNNNSVWQASVVLLHREQRLFLNGTGVTAQLAAQAVMDQAVNYFARLNAIVIKDEANTPALMIKVTNITGFAAYARLLNQLENLPIIAGTMVSYVEGDQLIVSLRYNGTEDKVLATLGAADFLIRLPASLPANLPANLPSSVPPQTVPPAPPMATFTWREAGVK
jgi:uncharacterized protein